MRERGDSFSQSYSPPGLGRVVWWGHDTHDAQDMAGEADAMGIVKLPDLTGVLDTRPDWWQAKAVVGMEGAGRARASSVAPRKAHRAFSSRSQSVSRGRNCSKCNTQSNRSKSRSPKNFCSDFPVSPLTGYAPRADNSIGSVSSILPLLSYRSCSQPWNTRFFQHHTYVTRKARKFSALNVVPIQAASEEPSAGSAPGSTSRARTLAENVRARPSLV